MLRRSSETGISTLLGGAAITWSLPPWPQLEGLRHGLRDLGYVEGRSHRFEYPDGSCVLHKLSAAKM
jgi:hypothetical protein